MEFKLPYGIVIDAPTLGVAAILNSDLQRELGGEPESEDRGFADGAISGVERLLMAMAAEGIDLSDPRFAKAIQTTVEAIGNNLD